MILPENKCQVLDVNSLHLNGTCPRPPTVHTLYQCGLIVWQMAQRGQGKGGKMTMIRDVFKKKKKSVKSLSQLKKNKKNNTFMYFVVLFSATLISMTSEY